MNNNTMAMLERLEATHALAVEEAAKTPSKTFTETVNIPVAKWREAFAILVEECPWLQVDEAAVKSGGANAAHKASKLAILRGLPPVGGPKVCIVMHASGSVVLANMHAPQALLELAGTNATSDAIEAKLAEMRAAKAAASKPATTRKPRGKK